MVRLRDLMGPVGKGARLWLCCFAMGTCSSVRVWILNNDIISVFSATDPFARDVVYTCAEILPLVAIALLARFRPTVLSNRLLSCTAAASAAIGAAMFLCVDAWAVPGWPQIAYALCILGGMWVSAALALSLCKLANPRSVALCVCSAYAAASVLEWAMSSVPLEARVASWVALTCIVLVLAYPLASDMIREAAEVGDARDLVLSQPRSFVSPFNVAFLSLLALKLVSGFSLALNSVSGVPVHTFVTGLVPLLAGVWIVLSGRERGQEDALFQIASLLVIAGVLAAMVSILHSLGTTSNVLLASASECFALLQMLVVVSMAARNKIDAVYVVACSQAYTSVGTMLGAGAGHAANGIATASDAATLAFLAALLFLFVVFCFVWLRRVSFERIIYGIQPVKPLVIADSHQASEKGGSFESRCARLAAQRGLTKRETEIMAMLARGRNGKFIEEHYVVSYNTVKTHVKHIYMKLDVHSQQELIDAVEHFGDEGASASRSESGAGLEPAPPREGCW